MKKISMIVLVTTLIAGLVLGGCAQTTPTTPPATTATATPTPSALIPKYGGILKQLAAPMPANIGWPAEMAGYGGGSLVWGETLLREDNKGNILPWLAESYKIADDFKSLTFNLRKGIRFHDGSDFNAEAVKWNLENFINAKRKTNWASVDIIDDYTIKVNFTEWRNTLLSSFGDADPPVFIISKAAFDKNGIEWVRANPVGTGPFKFENFTQDVMFKVVKNPDYWVEDKPYLEGIDAIIVADQNTSKMLFKSGEGDTANAQTPRDAVEFANMGMTIKTIPFVNWGIVPDTANTGSPWANQKVCEAVEYALNREAIAEAFGNGYWQPLYQIPPRYTLAYEPDFPLARKYDPEKAKQLLAEAGYPGGFKTTLIVIPMADKDVAVAMQADLAKVGIEVNLDFPEIGKWVSYMGPGTWQSNAALYTLVPAMDLYYTGGLQWVFVQMGQSWARPSEVMQALDTALNSRTQDIKLIRAVTDMMTKNAMFLPVNEGPQFAVERPYVMDTGMYERGTSNMWNPENTWLNK